MSAQFDAFDPWPDLDMLRYNETISSSPVLASLSQTAVAACLTVGMVHSSKEGALFIDDNRVGQIEESVGKYLYPEKHDIVSAICSFGMVLKEGSRDSLPQEFSELLSDERTINLGKVLWASSLMVFEGAAETRRVRTDAIPMVDSVAMHEIMSVMVLRLACRKSPKLTEKIVEKYQGMVWDLRGVIPARIANMQEAILN